MGGHCPIWRGDGVTGPRTGLYPRPSVRVWAVPPFPPDVNCGDIGQRVTVVGSDPHGLDRDGDGAACEAS